MRPTGQCRPSFSAPPPPPPPARRRRVPGVVWTGVRSGPASTTGGDSGPTAGEKERRTGERAVHWFPWFARPDEKRSTADEAMARRGYSGGEAATAAVSNYRRLSAFADVLTVIIPGMPRARAVRQTTSISTTWRLTVHRIRLSPSPPPSLSISLSFTLRVCY